MKHKHGEPFFIELLKLLRNQWLSVGQIQSETGASQGAVRDNIRNGLDHGFLEETVSPVRVSPTGYAPKVFRVSRAWVGSTTESN